MHIPDGWSLIKNSSGEFFVFSSWSDGFLDMGCWIMKRGVTSYYEDEDYHYFVDPFGCVYKCNKKCNNISLYNRGILAVLTRSSTKSKIVTVEEFKGEFQNARL